MGHGQPMPVTGLMVAGNFFQTLGVEPSIGRLFTAEETLPKSRPVVLLSHAFWKRQYSGDRGIVGQTIELNGTPVTVIGVMPDEFRLRLDLLTRLQGRYVRPGHLRRYPG
jgi:hypothetical protein